MKHPIAALALVIAGGFHSYALSDDVTLTVNVTKLSDGRVRLNGKTNLPPGTKLMLSVQEKTESGFHGQSSCFISGRGEFSSEAFGPKSGLKDGRYVAGALMPIPAVQSSSVKEIIGKKGEHLTGSLVKKGRFGITVSQQAEFTIGTMPDAAQAERKKQADAATVELKKQLCIHLEQLLSFKDDPKFKHFGFGTGDHIIKPPQENSWVNSGSGRAPRLWYRAVS